MSWANDEFLCVWVSMESPLNGEPAVSLSRLDGGSLCIPLFFITSYTPWLPLVWLSRAIPRVRYLPTHLFPISLGLFLAGRPCGLAPLAMTRGKQRDSLGCLYLSIFMSLFMSYAIYPILRSIFFTLQVSPIPSYPPTTFSHYSLWQESTSLPLSPLVLSTDNYLPRSSMEGVINLSIS